MRQILCPTCANRFELYPEDRADGLVMRKTQIAKAKRPSNPEENQIVINGTEVIQIPMDVVACDSCNTNVFGQPAVAVSVWRKSLGILKPWEQEFAG